MPFGRFYGAGSGAGLGMWCRGGRGFGFRGSSPPWHYVGLGRGGLPRCGYFFGGAAAMPLYQGIPSSDPTQEVSFLKQQSQAINRWLEQIKARISDLEAGK